MSNYLTQTYLTRILRFFKCGHECHILYYIDRNDGYVFLLYLHSANVEFYSLLEKKKWENVCVDVFSDR